VNREKSRDKSASPDGSRHSAEEPEKQQGAEEMEDNVGCVKTAGIKAVNPMIQHQGQPRQGMPEFAECCTERPVNRIKSDAGFNIFIIDDISGILVIDEVIAVHLPENGKRDQCQQYINYKFLFIGTDIEFIGHYPAILAID
jgi:hypothetical protein